MSFPINVPYKKHGEAEHKRIFRVSPEKSPSAEFKSMRSSTQSPIDGAEFLNSNGSSYIQDANRPSRMTFLVGAESNPVDLNSNLSLLGPETHNPVFNVHSVVKNRNGSVLGRKTILKSEHVDAKIRPMVDFYLQGTFIHAIISHN